MNTFTQLPTHLDPHRLPQHVAIIMDGNGRWATHRGLPRIVGHQQGAQRVKDLLRCCKHWGISTLTVYAFSTENWQRPLPEVEFLMTLFEGLLRQELAELHQEQVRIQFIGDRAALPLPLQSAIVNATELTQFNQSVRLNVAVNYGSRTELLQVMRQLAMQVEQGTLCPDTISETTIQQLLDTADQPDPDLLIRTSGEQRLSNFLLWQLAYTELYFTPTLWPDFGRAEFSQALLEYQRRDRRFGQLQTHTPQFT